MTQRTKLLLLLAIFAVPTIASFVAFYFLPPPPANSYGELISPAIPLPEAPPLRLDGGGQKGQVAMRGKWLIVMRDQGGCDSRCRAKLLVMRQARLVLGREQDRVSRVVLVEDDLTPEINLQNEFDGTIWLAASASAWLKQLPFPAGKEPRAFLYIVDPLGNVFMRYEEAPDVKRMANDLRRVLKASQIG